MFLDAIQRKTEPDLGVFPWNLPVFRYLERVQFTAPVTFLVGENGSGKSTLLEALACAIGSTTVGSESVTTDPSLAEVRKLAQHLRLAWTKRTQKGFFLRAEDFFGYARTLTKMREELERDIQSVDETYQGRSMLASALARLPHKNELQAMDNRYGGRGLDTYSH